MLVLLISLNSLRHLLVSPELTRLPGVGTLPPELWLSPGRPGSRFSDPKTCMGSVEGGGGPVSHLLPPCPAVQISRGREVGPLSSSLCILSSCPGDQLLGGKRASSPHLENSMTQTSRIQIQKTCLLNKMLSILRPCH